VGDLERRREEDPNGNVFPRKERAEGKIDPAVALILAIGRALADDGGASVYDDADERPNGFLSL
jgi:phage terminase large subunit-like protein